METDEFGRKRKYREIRGYFETFILLVCLLKSNKEYMNSTRYEHNLHRRYRRRRRRNKHLHREVLMVDVEPQTRTFVLGERHTRLYKHPSLSE